MSVQIGVRLAQKDVESLDAAVARGVFVSRAAAIRAGLLSVLREERETQIEAAYRRAALAAPEEQLVGEAGLRLGSELLAADEAAPQR